MKKSAFFVFIFSSICSLIGAAFYSCILMYSTEEGTGFINESGPYFVCMWTLSIIFFAVAGVYSVTYKYNWYKSFQSIITNSHPLFISANVASAVLVLLSSVFDIMRFVSGGFLMTSVVRAVFAFIAFSAIIKLISQHIRGIPDDLYSIYALAPTLWCSFTFMLIFKDNAPNPIIASYILELFAGLCIMLSVFRYSSFSFRRKGLRFCVLFSLSAMFFTTSYYGGEFLAFISSGRSFSEPLAEIIGMFGMMLYSSANAYNLMLKSADNSSFDFFG